MLGRTPCDICKGACCEFVGISLRGLPDDVGVWIAAHGDRHGDKIFLPCRCKHLTNHGQCEIYATRPGVCRVFEVGSEACIQAINSRRPLNTANKVKLAIARMGKEQ